MAAPPKTWLDASQQNKDILERASSAFWTDVRNSASVRDQEAADNYLRIEKTLRDKTVADMLDDISTHESIPHGDDKLREAYIEAARACFINLNFGPAPAASTSPAVPAVVTLALPETGAGAMAAVTPETIGDELYALRSAMLASEPAAAARIDETIRDLKSIRSVDAPTERALVTSALGRLARSLKSSLRNPVLWGTLVAGVALGSFATRYFADAQPSAGSTAPGSQEALSLINQLWPYLKMLIGDKGWNPDDYDNVMKILRAFKSWRLLNLQSSAARPRTRGEALALAIDHMRASTPY